MELILNLNQYSYLDFIDSKIDIFIVALKDYSSGYLTSYSLDELTNVIKEIKSKKKKVYLAINRILNEDEFLEFTSIFSYLTSLDIDSYVISDFGIINLFKKANLVNKICFNPITNLTNKYSCKSLNEMGINHLVLANELNLNDICEIASYCKGIELLAQGYYQICNSKRLLLSNFLKKFKIKSNSPYYYIQEETRDYAYPIIELNNEILIYIDKQRCLVPYFESLKNKIDYLRIDTMFLTKQEIDKYISLYLQLLDNKIDTNIALDKIKNDSNLNLKCLDTISVLKKVNSNE